MKTPIEALEQARETLVGLIPCMELFRHVRQNHSVTSEIASIDAVLRTNRCARCQGTGEVVESCAVAGYYDAPCPVCRKGEAS